MINICNNDGESWDPKEDVETKKMGLIRDRTGDLLHFWVEPKARILPLNYQARQVLLRNRLFYTIYYYVWQYLPDPTRQPHSRWKNPQSHILILVHRSRVVQFDYDVLYIEVLLFKYFTFSGIRSRARTVCNRFLDTITAKVLCLVPSSICPSLIAGSSRKLQNATLSLDPLYAQDGRAFRLGIFLHRSLPCWVWSSWVVAAEHSGFFDHCSNISFNIIYYNERRR